MSHVLPFRVVVDPEEPGVWRVAGTTEIVQTFDRRSDAYLHAISLNEAASVVLGRVIDLAEARLESSEGEFMSAKDLWRDLRTYKNRYDKARAEVREVDAEEEG